MRMMEVMKICFVFERQKAQTLPWEVIPTMDFSCLSNSKEEPWKNGGQMHSFNQTKQRNAQSSR